MEGPYKGYWLIASPHLLVDESRWSTNVLILADGGSQLIHRPFGAKNTFETEEEAEAYSINLGREIIDGKMEGFSVADLPVREDWL